ncbi:C40 family peptidase [Deinococcus ruber]|uniref:Peptidase n=1 Tax=Deinococcus ruber TaxID=1848197 RepID=A0A918F3I0_9DEIO|nr:LysM peptidoglycan-binding domain-containing C40 family peptidase [Deinococcus ruber]GGQ97738.1 peptidase [Deinococcus ruber]
MKAFRVLSLAVTLLASSAFASTYTVKPGDTLSSIARMAGMEPAALMQQNHLSTTTLQVGQKVQYGTATSPSKPSAQASAPQRSSGGAYIRAAASRFLNIRYVLGGTGGRGIDCSAYTRAVFSQLGVNLPRTAREQFRVGTPVSRGNLQAGDLVFFNTIGGVSHVGIYLGNGQFANANSYQGRTIIESMTTAYWSAHYIGARRVLNG